jgi:hypothetical protein
MQWIRRNNRFGSWIALLALAIQLVLSFGHVHLEDIQASSPVTTDASQAQTRGANGTGPADDDHGKAGHDFCAVCAALSLTSNSVLPAVVLPATPVDHPHKWFASFHPVQASYGIHFLFQARAPPHTI